MSFAAQREQKSAKAKDAEELLDAALEGDLAAVQASLKKGVAVDVRDHAGHTPLSEACCGGHAKVAAFLIERGAKVDAHCHELKRSALHRAAFHGYADCCALLVKNGAPQRPDAYGEKPEHLTTSDRVRAALRGELVEDEPPKAKEAEKPKGGPTRKEWASPPKAEKAEAVAKADAGGATEAAEKAKADAETAATPEASDVAMADADEEAEKPKLRRVQRKLFVEGAGEARVNGSYSYLPDQIDETWVKDGDDKCVLSYRQHKQEWTMVVANYKKWNTLYRVMERRAEPKNIVIEEKENGDCVLMKRPPAEPPEKAQWLKWFGVSPVPTVTAVTVDVEQWEAAAAAAAEVEAAAAEQAAESLPGAKKLEITEEPQKREFLEVKSSLEIVARDKNAAETSADTAAVEVVEGNRIVETADGLFAPEELEEESSWEPVPTPVTPEWAALTDAKDQAAQLFRTGDFAACASLFTGCLGAMRMLSTQDWETAEEVTEAELKDMRTTLLANRALACIKLEQWKMAAEDCDQSLSLDPKQFKVYYRRALARRELGQLELALEDATKVCEHYMTQPAPNPEAWELRDSIIAKLKEERKKWHNGPRARAWNKTIAQAPPKDLSLPAVFAPQARAKPVGKGLQAPQKPRNSGEVEKHLQYWRKHGGGDDYVKALPAALVSKVAWSPDILGTMVGALLRVAATDPSRSYTLLQCMKADSLTWAMLDDAEQAQRTQLLEALRPLGVDLTPWQ